jgi:hypothetical protein
MGVVDGQAVSATVTNPAFINKNTNDTMANILSFARALSGATISDIQAAVNKLYTATGASESATGTLYNATASTIINGDSHLTALTELANKFDPSTGHKHTGAAGDGTPVNAVNIAAVPLLGYIQLGSQISSATGTSTDITSLMSGKSASTNSTTPGVSTTSPNNKVNLFYISGVNGGQDIVDANGNLVYGRVTFSAGTWTLSYYSLVSSTETAYSFSGSPNLKWYYQELFNPLSAPSVYAEELQLKSSNSTSNIIQATSSLYGKTILSTGTPTDIASSGSAGTANGTVSNSDHTHKGVRSIDAGGGQAFGDITLAASGGFVWTDTGATKTGYAPPLATFNPNPVAATVSLGTSLKSAKEDHVHVGLHSFSLLSQTALVGDATISATNGIQGIQTGQNVALSTVLTTKGDLMVGNGSNTSSRLGVGSNNQMLRANSAQSTGLEWATVIQTIAASGQTALTGDVTLSATKGLTATQVSQNIEFSTPITTKGDLMVGSGTNTANRLGVGSNNQMLRANSAQSLGVEWAAMIQTIAASGQTALTGDVTLSATKGLTATQSSQNIEFSTPITTKGDLMVGNGSNTADRLAVGSNGQYLVADSTQSTGIKWATSEVIAARYTSTAGQTIVNNTTFAIVDFETQTYDTASAVTTGASWKFTAPITARYNCKACINVQNFTPAVGEFDIRLFKNGSQVSNFAQPIGGAVVSTSINDDILLTAGDYIDFRAFQNNGTNKALHTNAVNVYCSIHKIGD